MAKQMTITNQVFFTVFLRSLKSGQKFTRRELAARIVGEAYPQRVGEDDDLYNLRITPAVGTTYTRLGAVIKNLEDGTCEVFGNRQKEVLALVNKCVPDARGRKKGETPNLGELLDDLFGGDDPQNGDE